ncbi:MAG: tRNA (adenosine(37)-N6)-threonylcarbamoyltransferase complex dimerization subunit type 1 TsaB [bacterium]
MHLLAIENSTTYGSLAILDGARVIAEQNWIELRPHRAALFDGLQKLLVDTGLPAEAFGSFAVGLGPGGFAGLRMAVSLAQGLALPGGALLHAVSSAAVIAAGVLRETSTDRVAVIGDARRGRVWMGVFDRCDGGPGRAGEWELLPDAATLAARLDAQQVQAVASPDAEAISLAMQVSTAGRLCLPAVRRPTAAGLGQLVHTRRAHAIVSEPLTPIYIHPAVSVPPRFFYTTP